MVDADTRTCSGWAIGKSTLGVHGRLLRLPASLAQAAPRLPPHVHVRGDTTGEQPPGGRERVVSMLTHQAGQPSLVRALGVMGSGVIH